MPKKASKTYHKNVNSKDIRVWRNWQKSSKLFAIVGLLVAAVGGWWAFQTFAATASYGIFPSQMVYSAGGITTKLVEEMLPGAKKKQDVIEAKLVDIDKNHLPVAEAALNGFVTNNAGHTAQVCANVRALAVPANFFIEIHGMSSSPPGDVADLKSIPATYTKFCTPEFKIVKPSCSDCASIELSGSTIAALGGLPVHIGLVTVELLN